MANRYTGTATVDEIDMPLCNGKLRLVGDVTIRVTVDVDPGYTRDDNGDGCPPAEICRDYDIVEADFSVYCGDDLVYEAPTWDHLGPDVKGAIREKYLDAACENCDCCEECD
jgi:hypothetical protein